MTTDCVFCRIAAGSLPARLEFESESVVAFRDRIPQAPVHVLVVPRRHIESLADAAEPELLGALLRTAADVAAAAGLAQGFRVVVNTGADGGQSVGHLHLHVLGGRPMGWPPG